MGLEAMLAWLQRPLKGAGALWAGTIISGAKALSGWGGSWAKMTDAGQASGLAL